MNRADQQTYSGIFFIHIMKTGGTSLDETLKALFAGGATYPGERVGPAVEEKVDIRALQRHFASPGCPTVLVSVHMPAWVAEQVAPNHMTMTVLREPVSRTLSHLRHLARMGSLPDDIEALYDQPLYRRRLANYQTRIFSMTEAQLIASEEATSECQRRVAIGSEEAREELMELMRAFFATAMPTDQDLTARDLKRAIERLGRIDEVGTTERLDDLVRRVGSRWGADLREVGRHNVAHADAPAPASLIEQIRADNALDSELYEHARRLAGDI